MRRGWEAGTLGSVSTIRPPKREARELLQPDDLVSFMPMEDLKSGSKYAVPGRTIPLCRAMGSYTYFRDGDVLLPKISPCFENGKLGIAADLVNGIGFGSSEYIVLRPSERVLAEWLYYYLSRSELREEGTRLTYGTVGQRRIPKEFVHDYPIPIAPLSEQERIVAILDEGFKDMEIAAANAKKNLADSLGIVDSCLESVFHQRGDDWVALHQPLSSLCVLIVDCEHKTAPTQEQGIPSVRTPNIGKGRLLLEDVYRVSEETYREWTRRAEPLAGDLVLAREAPAGNVAVIPPEMRMCLGQRTVLIRPRTDVFEPAFLAYLLLSPEMQARFLAHSRGATVEHVNMRDIRALDVGPIPPIDVQREIVSRLNAVSEESSRLVTLFQRKLAALDALKNSLLDHAFSGNL